MFLTVSPAACRPSCVAVIRCQVTPSAEVQITAWVAPAPAAPVPAARNPLAVLVTTNTESPGSWGVIPCVAARVQDSPFWLVQMACGPTATHPPGPPASSGAGCPRGGWTPVPPAMVRTGASCQLAPALDEVKNCWRTTPSLTCEPDATMVLPEATMRLIVWKTPRCCCPA